MNGTYTTGSVCEELDSSVGSIRQRVLRQVNPVYFYKSQLPGMPDTKFKSGWVSGGLCPFHDDTRPTSFRINLDHGGYKCHACGASGDMVKFLMEFKGVNFLTAKRILLRREDS